MIERWEILPAPHERYPNRIRVNVAADESDLRALPGLFPKQVGKLWSPRVGQFRFSFYFYEATPSDRDTLKLFLSGKAPVRREASEADYAEAPPVDIEILTEQPGSGERQEPVSRPKADSPLVESAGDALQDWALGKESPASRKEDFRAAPEKPRAKEEVEAVEEQAAKPEQTEVISTTSTEAPAERLVLSDEPAPEIPAGFLYLRLAYFVPHDVPQLVDEIHQILVQTLQSRNMPFVFHKVFGFQYQWPDRPLVDQVVEACLKHKVDALVCVGDSKRLELLLERCTQEGVKHYSLSREDARKRYWRLGLITRIVVKEE